MTTPAERVAFLGRYLKLRAPVSDATFHVAFQDNSGGVPGPSDWSIQAALRVNPSDRTLWLADARAASPEEAASPFADARRRAVPPEWAISSPGELYRRDGSWIVWHPEGALEFSAATR